MWFSFESYLYAIVFHWIPKKNIFPVTQAIYEIYEIWGDTTKEPKAQTLYILL